MNWKALIIIMASVFLLAACGKSGSAEVDSQTTPSTEVPSGETATPTKRGVSSSVEPGERIDGGTLVRLWSDPPTLDPHLTTDATSATIIVEVFGGLVTIDPELEIVGDLAERWDVSDVGTVYTFHLRKDAKFHSGKAVTAHDFKWSIERASDPLTAAPVVDQYLGDIIGVKERLSGDADEVRGVKVIDDHTLQITIDAPKSYFTSKLTYPTAFVLDQENVEGSRRWFREPNGTGPFKLTEYVPGTSMVLSRNENFHLGPPNLETVRFILSGGTAMLMYEGGEIDLTGVGLADLERVLDPASSLNSELHKAPPVFSTEYIGMNNDEPPFDDIKVRQALNYAIDKETIARDVLASLVTPAQGILPPGFPGYNPDLDGFEYNPTKAKELLAQSKYGGDLSNFPRVFLTVAGSFGASPTLDMEVIQEMWRQNLGIEINIQQTEFATYLQDLVRRRFQMFEIGWIADYPDPENFLDLLFHSQSTNNHTAYVNTEVDQILEKARTEPDLNKRYELYNQAEELIVNDAPWIPLWYSGDQYLLIKPNVHDFFLTPLVIPKLRFVYLTG